MKKMALLLCLTACLALTSCSDNISKPLEKDDKIKLKTTTDTEIILKKSENGFLFNDKALLLVFFTTDCVPCKAQSPHLNKLQKNYSDNLTIIAAMLDNKPLNDIKNFEAQNDINFIVTYGKESFKLSSTLGNVTSVPYMIIYDKNGNEAANYTGAVPEEMIESDLKQAL